MLWCEVVWWGWWGWWEVVVWWVAGVWSKVLSCDVDIVFDHFHAFTLCHPTRAV